MTVWKSNFGRPTPSTRRPSVTASARWRGDSTPSTRRCRWRGVNCTQLDGAGAHAVLTQARRPCAFLNLDGEKRKSRVVKKNINPQWMQTFRFPCDDGFNVHIAMSTSTITT